MDEQSGSSPVLQSHYVTFVLTESDFRSISDQDRLKSLALAIKHEAKIGVADEELDIFGGQVRDLKGVNCYTTSQAQITFLLNSGERKLTITTVYHRRYEVDGVERAIKSAFPKSQKGTGNSTFYQT